MVGGEGVGDDRLAVARGCAAPPGRPASIRSSTRLVDVAGRRRDLRARRRRRAASPGPSGSSRPARPRAPCAAAAAAPSGIGEKPSLFWITSPPAKFSSTTWATELFSPAAKTVTKATSGEADHQRRRGDRGAARVALGVLAREPAGQAAQPLQRPAGDRRQRRHQARAEERDGEDDRDRAAAHQPGARSPALALPKRPSRTSASPASAEQRPRAPGRRSRRRRLGGGAKACRAAIGGTRVERSAGISEETRVTTIADQQRDDDRPRLQHQARRRQVDPERFEAGALSSIAMSEAAGDPEHARRAGRSPAPRPRPR